jgi:acylglycerol lipase
LNKARDLVLLEDFFKVPGNLKEFKLPILVLHGSSDRMTCPLASKRILNAISSSDKTHKDLQGYYHEIHNEPRQQRMVAYREYVKWIEDHI